jgi:hypothetical protein
MVDSPENTSEQPNPRLEKEYEDPHYHDEDEVAQVANDDLLPRPHAVPGGRKPRGLLPPRRRFQEE